MVLRRKFGRNRWKQEALESLTMSLVLIVKGWVVMIKENEMCRSSSRNS
jgi:hypothetical protein